MSDDKWRGPGRARPGSGPGPEPERNPDDLFGIEDEWFQRRDRDRDRERPRIVGDFVRRAIENTVGQVQNTGSVSREALHYLLQQGDRGRREMVRLVAHEVGDFLRHTDVASEVVRVMTSIQVDVSASVRFRPVEGGGVKPEVTQDVSVQPAEPETDDGTEGVAGDTEDPIEPVEEAE
ncbi:MAG TPA: hypothetical protein RMG48_04895 [Myxococcales bacterium LLY-WYZ-16_1]|jgi:hypothetical protein|nr:hypothetical protein [Myxococcales bacterium LLY-WYZ-16_1]